MDVDLFSTYFTDELATDASKVPMSTLGPQFGNYGLSMPWVAASGESPGLNNLQDSCFNDLMSYDSYYLGTDTGDSDHKLNTGCADWLGPSSASTNPFPGSFGPFASQSNSLGANGDGRDSDTDYHDSEAVSPISPVSTTSVSAKRRSIPECAKQALDYPSQIGSSRATKRTCANAAESARRARNSTKDRAEPSSRSKPKARTRSTRKSSDTSSIGSNQSNSPKTQLRTACRKAKPPSPSTSEAALAEQEDDSLTVEERRARQSHNAVEKQYRNRLNQQFESLLAVLPDDGGDGGEAGDDRRLSKAEVLERARRRIRELEYESKALRRERAELLNNVGIMPSRMPGGLIPSA